MHPSHQIYELVDLARFWRDTPRPTLSDPPTEGQELGRRVRGVARLNCLGDVLQLAAAAAVTVDVVESENYAGPQAYLLPKMSGGFRMVVADLDLDRLNRSAPRRVPDRLADSFLVAHELGHLFFYDRERRPARRTRRATEREEDFCDEFAISLLGIPG